MDRAHDLRLRQHQQVVVALDVMRMVAQAFPAIAGLVEPVALDHRAHRPVQEQDALVQQGFELGGAVGLHGGRWGLIADLDSNIGTDCRPRRPANGGPTRRNGYNGPTNEPNAPESRVLD